MPTMNITRAFIFLLLLLIDNVTCKTKGEQLADLVNAYRRSKGLSTIPYSTALMKVAKLHVEVSCKVPSLRNRKCWNPHSWDYVPGMSQNYKTCCYSPFNGNSFNCIWDKPREIAGFNEDGFEITSGGGRTLSDFLNGWKRSSSHNEVILTSNSWKYYKWKSIGCAAVMGSVAHCWFSKKADGYYRSPGEPSCGSGRFEVESESDAPSPPDAANAEHTKIATGWVVGGSILLVVIVAVAVLFCLYMRRKRRETQGVKVHDTEANIEEDEDEEEEEIVIKFADKNEVEMDGEAITKTVA